MASVLTNKTRKSASSRHRMEDDATSNLPEMPENLAKDLVQLFKLLADETRLRILYFLMQRHELNVRTLCGLLGQSQPAVSHHLALLRVAGLIQCRRDGKHNYYRLLPERFQELLGGIFAAAPEQAPARFEDFMRRFAQPTSAE